MNDLRDDARAHVKRMVAAGPGWHPYALARAEAMVRAEPMVHGGLVAEAEAAMGPDAVKKARRALEWFEKHPAGMGDGRG